jgi:hypothetical protein
VLRGTASIANYRNFIESDNPENAATRAAIQLAVLQEDTPLPAGFEHF